MQDVQRLYSSFTACYISIERWKCVLYFLNCDIRTRLAFFFVGKGISEQFRHDGFPTTEAESMQSTGRFAIVDSAQIVCTLLRRHIGGKARNTEDAGWRGSKRIYANASWLGSFVFISWQGNSYFIILGTVSIPLTILSRCFCVSQGCLSGSYTGLMERLKTKLTSVPLAIFLFFWESNLFITVTVVEKVLSDCIEFFCKYNTFWKSVCLLWVTCILLFTTHP